MGDLNMTEFKNFQNPISDKEFLTHLNDLRNKFSNISMIDIGGKHGIAPEFAHLTKGFNYSIMEYDKNYVTGPNRIYGDITDCNHIKDNSYEFVYSVNTLEHVTEPWAAADNMARILKTNGLMFIIAPWMWNYHEHPIDYWRFSPTGLEYLFKRTNKMTTLFRGYYEKRLSLYLGIKHGI